MDKYAEDLEDVYQALAVVKVVVLLLSLAHYSACAWHYIGWPGDSPEHYEQAGLTMLQSISNWGYDSPPIGLQFTSNWVVLRAGHELVLRRPPLQRHARHALLHQVGPTLEFTSDCVVVHRQLRCSSPPIVL